MRLGAHVSVAGGLDLAPGRAREIGASALQLFTRNARTWRTKPIGVREARAFRDAREAAGIDWALAHLSYLPNLASPAPGMLRRARFALRREVDRAIALGLDAIVFHPGAALDAPREVALDRVAGSLRFVLDRAAAGPVDLLLENTAGSGTVLGPTFEEPAHVLDRLDGHPRVGVCLDTAHAWGAGYEMTGRGLGRTIRRAESLLGRSRIRAFHLNDTPVERGSHRDRHAGIGEGKLGLETFRTLHRMRRFARVPGILETPSGMEGWAREIAAIRSRHARPERGQ